MIPLKICKHCNTTTFTHQMIEATEEKILAGWTVEVLPWRPCNNIGGKTFLHFASSIAHFKLPLHRRWWSWSNDIFHEGWEWTKWIAGPINCYWYTKNSHYVHQNKLHNKKIKNGEWWEVSTYILWNHCEQWSLCSNFWKLLLPTDQKWRTLLLFLKGYMLHF